MSEWRNVRKLSSNRFSDTFLPTFRSCFVRLCVNFGHSVSSGPLRKIALNLVAADRSSQTSLRGRRRKAVWNDDYMLRIITRQLDA
jgi:hypothetical protein